MYPLLLLTLTGWCWCPALGCDTAVAFPGQSLSLYRSSLSNADVALLGSHEAADVNGCLHDCCTNKYGSCSVASFKRNATGGNCQLFNCRPVQMCKFVSSNSTDSFSFSSSTLPRVLVPSSRHASSDRNSSSTTTTTTTTTSTLLAEVDEPLASKNGNATVKPRKGVLDGLKDIFGNEERSGSKPRKGVSLEGGESSKSKVKPRKGVGPQPDVASTIDDDASVTSKPSERKDSRPSPTPKTHQDVVADDLVSALEQVFEDDTRDKPLFTSSKEFPADNNPLKTSVMAIRPSSSIDYRDVIPTSLTTLLQPLSASIVDTTTSGLLLPSLTTSQLVATSQVATSSARTPYLQTGLARATGVFGHNPTPTSPTILEHSRLIFHEVSGHPDSMESESERKYKSSMHLVLSLVFGLLILVSVLGVVAKRVYDSWMRRHYRRMDFLIDGMYNGYG